MTPEERGDAVLALMERAILHAIAGQPRSVLTALEEQLVIFEGDLGFASACSEDLDRLMFTVASYVPQHKRRAQPLLDRALVLRLRVIMETR